MQQQTFIRLCFAPPQLRLLYTTAQAEVFTIVGGPCEDSRPRPQHRFMGDTDDTVALRIDGRRQNASLHQSIDQEPFGRAGTERIQSDCAAHGGSQIVSTEADQT